MRESKNMSEVFKNTGKFDRVLKRNQADLKEYSGCHSVEIRWDLNHEAIRDRIFKLIIDDDTELYLDLEEFLAYTRAI